MTPTLKIGLAGLGTVGQGFVQLLTENAEILHARTGYNFQLKTVAVQNKSKSRKLPDNVNLCYDPQSLTQDPELDVIIELMGGLEQARDLICHSLKAGKHVITANKALLAEDGNTLFKLAAQAKVSLLYEASVAGGIPIIQTLKESLAGNQILSLEGILNGTSNYILSEMTSKGLDFAPALAEAQAKGYAEIDPTLDIDGFDTAHKLVLLIRLAFGMDYPFKAMPIQGIRHLERMDIDFAKSFGYQIKLLGRAKMETAGIMAGVFPTLVRHSLLANVGGAFNAIAIEGNAVGPLFLHGAGAGSLPTASSVLGDLMSIARKNHILNSGYTEQVLPQAEIIPPSEAYSCYYLRLMVKDDSGVMRDIAGALAHEKVSIAQAIQKEETIGGVPLVFMTHKAKAISIQKAIAQIAQKNFLLCPITSYRILD